MTTATIQDKPSCSPGFTNGLIHVLDLAREVARMRNEDYTGKGHLLVALCDVDSRQYHPLSEVLSQFGISMDAFRAAALQATR